MERDRAHTFITFAVRSLRKKRIVKSKDANLHCQPRIDLVVGLDVAYSELWIV